MGHVPSFLKSLFRGVVEDRLVFPYPELSGEERESLGLMVESLRRFAAARVDSARIDREHEIPRDVLDGLRDLGLFGLAVPEAYGGLGLSALGYTRMVQELAALDASLAVTLGAHQSIGLKGLLLFGTDAQKQTYLPRLATGELTAAFALTEPTAGSDAAAIRTRAEPDGRGGYVLNGSKSWITNGGFADLFTVFARTPSGDGGKGDHAISAFLVERSQGVRSGAEERKLGIRGSSTTALFFDDVHVGPEQVLGEPGRGFSIAMHVLNAGRLGLGAGAVGTCRRLTELALDRARERTAFGRPIGEFGLVREKLARMLADTYAIESMTYLAAGLAARRGLDTSLESAACKVYASETLWRVASDALQIAGGAGYMQDYPYERHLRDSRINLIFEGTNEILRLFISLSGMQEPGKELADVARVLHDPLSGLGPLSDFAVRKARSVLGRERLRSAHPALDREAVVFEAFAGELTWAVDRALRRHGRALADQQQTLGRIADLAIELFAVAACVARTSLAVTRRGEVGAERELELTSLFARGAERRMDSLVRGLDKNEDDLSASAVERAMADGARYPFDVL